MGGAHVVKWARRRKGRERGANVKGREGEGGAKAAAANRAQELLSRPQNLQAVVESPCFRFCGLRAGLQRKIGAKNRPTPRRQVPAVKHRQDATSRRRPSIHPSRPFFQHPQGSQLRVRAACRQTSASCQQWPPPPFRSLVSALPSPPSSLFQEPRHVHNRRTEA